MLATCKAVHKAVLDIENGDILATTCVYRATGVKLE